MMKFFKSSIQTLTATIALGTLSIGFAPAAASTFDATAGFELTLTNVTNLDNFQETAGWDVFALGVDSGVASDQFGNASSTGSTSVVDPGVSMSINDSITQTSISSGTATNGFSWTDALTDLDITVQNSSTEALTFYFDYIVTSIASVTGDNAIANASVDFLDTEGYVDIFAIADADTLLGPLYDDASTSGFLEFTLLAGETNTISGFIDTNGEAIATSVVPVPAAVWLFGSSLIGLIGFAKRKKA